MNEILLGDIRDIAKTLPAQSVNCIVTSPPYFGLRDYQTAKWEGGKAECEHKSNHQSRGNIPGTKQATNNQGEGGAKYMDCPKCGAKRIDKQIGLEESPEAYVDTLVGIFRKLKRVLRDDGTIWLNLGDSYAGNNSSNGEGETRNLKTEVFHGGSAHLEQRRVISNCSLKPKNLLGIPWRVAFALQADGWILRSDIIWHKKNPMPESVKDRPTKAHEYIFLLSKKPRYYYDNEVVREAYARPYKDGPGFGGFANRENTKSARLTAAMPMLNRTGIGANAKVRDSRNRRSVWAISTRPFRAAHFAVFPPDLIRPCILAGCPQQVCGECGEPWVRAIKKIGLTKHHGTNKTYQKDAKGQHGKTSVFITGQTLNKETIGIKPACNCNADTIPGVVLDPFMGSGTVAQVAIETGRNWLGVELNPEYIELAKERIYQTQPALPIEITL